MRKSWFARTRAAKALCVCGGGRCRGVGGGQWPQSKKSSVTAYKPQCSLDYEILLKSLALNLLGGLHIMYIHHLGHI